MKITSERSVPENRKTMSVSISVPVEVIEPMDNAATRRGMSRSQYLTWLVRNDLYIIHGMLPDIKTAPMPKVPLRIKPKD